MGMGQPTTARMAGLAKFVTQSCHAAYMALWRCGSEHCSQNRKRMTYMALCAVSMVKRVPTTALIHNGSLNSEYPFSQDREKSRRRVVLTSVVVLNELSRDESIEISVEELANQ